MKPDQQRVRYVCCVSSRLEASLEASKNQNEFIFVQVCFEMKWLQREFEDEMRMWHLVQVNFSKK